MQSPALHSLLLIHTFWFTRVPAPGPNSKIHTAGSRFTSDSSKRHILLRFA